MEAGNIFNGNEATLTNIFQGKFEKETFKKN